MTESPHPQGSPEWWALRRGRPTGSNFGRIVTPAKWELASGRYSYMAELIAECTLEGWHEQREGFAGSPDTERGKSQEGNGLRWLQQELSVEVRKPGAFVSECGRYADSPDGMTADGIPVEVKSRLVRKLIAEHMSGEVPRENIVQCHAHMVLTGADRCIYVATCDAGDVDNIMRVVPRDEKTERLREHVEAFCEELEEKKNELLQ